MNHVFLSGRITSDISRFGTDSKGGVSFTLVTSRPVIKDGEALRANAVETIPAGSLPLRARMGYNDGYAAHYR